MATGLIDYAGPAQVTFNGQPLIQPTSVRITRTSNNAKVKTLAGGLVGRTKGAPEVSITLENAVPLAGHEAKFNDLIFQSNDIFELGVEIASVVETFVCWTESSDNGSTVDQPVTNSVQLIGRRKTAQSV